MNRSQFVWLAAADPGADVLNGRLLIGLVAGLVIVVATTALIKLVRRDTTPHSGQSEHHYRLLAEHASDYIARLDHEGRFRYASPSWTTLGWSPERLIGTSALELVADDDRVRVTTALARLAGGGETGPLRFRMTSGHGGQVWVETTARGVPDPRSGELGEIQLAARDVSGRVAAEDALRSSKSRYRALVHGLREVVFETDPEGRWTFLSSAWTDVTGFECRESLGEYAIRYLDPKERTRQADKLVAFRDGAHPVYSATLRIRRRDGETRLVEVTARRQSDASGRMTGIVGTLDDRTEAVLTQRERDRLAEILEATSDVVATVDPAGRIGWMNRAGLLALGYRADATLAGRRIESLLPPEAGASFFLEATAAAGAHGVWSGEALMRRRDGTDLPFSQVVIAHQGPSGDVDRYSLIARDISQRKELEEQLSHLALRDPLTGLANRTLLLDRLTQALARAERSQDTLAVLFFDVDRFKLVNDSLGHTAGDHLLRALGRRVEGAIRPSDTAARFGGDEFVVLCEGFDEAGAVALAERIATILAQPLEVEGRELQLSTSIGIAIAAPGDDPIKVIGDADAAMYRAKALEPGSHRVFDETVRADQQLRLDFEARLGRAVERDELLLHYQPIVDSRLGTIRGVEALVRWQHPEHGIVSPVEFVSIAEESGAIVEIGAWVLEEAARQVARWRTELPAARDLYVSVNLSVQQIMAGDLRERVEAVLERTKLPPEALILEITESMVVSDPRATIATLSALRGLGVRFALDDFGTGYAPLTHLRQLPIDIVKVDRSFVVGLGAGAADEAIIAALVALADGLGLDLIAEGADRAIHVERLTALGCLFVQGYWFAPPLANDEAAALLESGLDPWWEGLQRVPPSAGILTA